MIRINARLQRELRALTSGQLQKTLTYTSAQSLSATAFDIQKSTRNRLPSWVSLTRKFLTSQVVVEKATTQRPIAKVGFTSAADFATLLESGGTRTPRNSRNLSIPVGVKRSKRGGITKSNRPRAQLDKRNVFVQRIHGHKGIFKRLRNGLTLLYSLVPQTHYRGGNINFLDNAERVARATLERNFRRILDRNLQRFRGR